MSFFFDSLSGGRERLGVPFRAPRPPGELTAGSAAGETPPPIPLYWINRLSDLTLPASPAELRQVDCLCQNLVTCLVWVQVVGAL